MKTVKKPMSKWLSHFVMGLWTNFDVEQHSEKISKDDSKLK